ncbi:hypothetical protein C0431_06955 [bacterium]|nr:hypothetical protein [bacterium]
MKDKTKVLIYGGIGFLIGAMVNNVGAQKRLESLPCSQSVAESAPWIVREVTPVRGPLKKIEEGIKEARAKAQNNAARDDEPGAKITLPGMEAYKAPEVNTFDSWLKGVNERHGVTK